jgi:antitoxin ParD1/3/4
MSSRTTLNVSLTPELDAFVADRVASGRFLTASEVVSEALRLLEAREQMREAALADLRREIAIGLEQAKRGDVFDGEAVFDELESFDGPPR